MLTSGFFNAVNGDRLYNADQISNMFKGLISDGIYESVGNAFIVKPTNGLTLSVGSGRAIVYDKWVESDADTNIILNAPHVTFNRYTAIVLRKSVSDRTVTLEMIDGEPATTPVKPGIVRNTSYYDICLAYVYVKGGATEITAANIEDTRTNTNICGFVTGLIKQVDTAELFNQYKAACEEDIARMTAWEAQQQAAFNTWFASLTEQLQVNTYIEESKEVYQLTSATTNINISSIYDAGAIIFVILGGVMLAEGVDYTISNGVITFIDKKFNGTDTVEVRVLKSKIGFTTN